MPDRGAAYRHRIRIRYGEVDQQGVVFNAHYLAYCDDAVDTWLRTLDVHFERYGWDLMLKRSVLEWQGPAGIGDVLDIDVGVARWGNTSFDVGFVGQVGERPVFTGTITYVGVAAGTTQPTPAPPEVRALLGEAAALA
jgi:acyl-CoA thioester hydrolase